MNMTPDLIDYLGYLAATLSTASFLPQVILTIRTKDTKALSLSMYILLTSGVFCWLLYGVYIENTVIVFANIITFVLVISILFFKIYNMLSNKE